MPAVLEMDLPVERILAEPSVARQVVPPGFDYIRTARGLEAVSYAACEAVLRNTALERRLPEVFRASGVRDETVLDISAGLLNNAQGDRHLRLRQALGAFFAPQRVEAARAMIAERIATLLARADRPAGLDLVRDVARHIPAHLFAHLIGVSPRQRAYFNRISIEAFRVFEMNPELGDGVTGAWRDAAAWVNGLIESQRGETGDTLLPYLAEQRRAGLLDEDEMRLAVTMLLIGSVDTTQGLMGVMMRAFVDCPDQWQALREDPSRVPAAVLEAARWRPAEPWIFRVAPDGVELEGIPARPGEHIYALIAAANRDPAVFENPDTFDINRVGEHLPLTWGLGRHFCLGRSFAVMELEELLLGCLLRWPALGYRDPVSGAAASYFSARFTLPVKPVTPV
ncbi:cytochrome P450 [Micromonospora sp. CPCC 205539]|uniref:cytochrome P450 n=1 Tax=Micromonospora sp. CPCC 205539 TaxID=3122408 RepID=UPI002FEF7ED9